MARNLIAVGPVAVRKAVEILAAEEFGRWQGGSLEPGAQWGGNHMLLSVGGGAVQFVTGNTVYRQDQEGFLRAEFPAGGPFPKRASCLRGFSPYEMPLCLGLAGELALVWPGIASVCVFLEQFSHFYRSHRTQIELAARELRYVAEGLLALQRWPALFDSVMDAMGEQARESLPKGLATADLGAFLGRLMIGAQDGRITLVRVPDCLHALREPLSPLPHHQRMLDKLERFADSVTPLIEQLSVAAK